MAIFLLAGCIDARTLVDPESKIPDGLLMPPLLFWACRYGQRSSMAQIPSSSMLVQDASMADVDSVDLHFNPNIAACVCNDPVRRRLEIWVHLRRGTWVLIP
jgi:hypothetical protein